ncbi:MAG: bifunctional phosphoribosyl-AMP cyclohydrolase/phosphoribosyl-ATP diphosphatase HisIE [Myxococcales bacterium]|nr:bifunctional phosphoribosyl-AMP cyclohydrolase/phosphoribosyl-ATP diphosphatase HisIE [Myxococcales bacterium]
MPGDDAAAQISQMPVFGENGLVPAIAQDARSGRVLMLAWMNEAAWRLTRDTGVMHFWSRSRGALWRKGETSGNELRVLSLRLDCDRDAVLALVEAAGPACHNGSETCFFDAASGGELATGASVLAELERTISARRAADAGASYTKSLLDGGAAKIGGKVVEEAAELVAELHRGDAAALTRESADLLFHMLVALASQHVSFGDVLGELARRAGTSGHVEKASRAKLP